MSVEVKGILMFGIYDSNKEIELSEEQIDLLYNSPNKFQYWDDSYSGEWQALGICLNETNEWNDKGPFKVDLDISYKEIFENYCNQYNINIPNNLKEKIGLYHFLYWY